MAIRKKGLPDNATTIMNDFLVGKPPHTIALFNHFVETFYTIGAVILYPTKTMIGIATPQRRIAWITQAGSNFLHVVFPFSKPYSDNLCFQKIVQVPADEKQFNHHFRMYQPEDANEEVQAFMRMAFEATE